MKLISLYFRVNVLLLSIFVVQAAKFCSSSDPNICIQANYVDGVTYLNLTAPSSYGWVGYGIGGGMVGSQMFILFKDANGATIVSPRKASGHVMPQVNQVDFTADGVAKSGDMAANITCPGCSITNPSAQQFIYASNSQPLVATSPSAQIQEHNAPEGTIYTLDLTKNTLPSSSDSSGNSSANSGSSSTPSSSENIGVVSVSASERWPRNTLIAHGVLMSMAFVILFPIGALFVRFLTVRAHYLFQTFTLMVIVVGFGLGVNLSGSEQLMITHQRLGVSVFILVWIQAFLGILHHQIYKRKQKKGFYHRWFGRIVIILGITNGTLGLDLIMAPAYGHAVFWVFAGIDIVVGGLFIFITWYRKKFGTHTKERDNEVAG